MATVRITFFKAGVSSGGDIMQAAQAGRLRFEDITASASNQQTTMTAESGDFVHIATIGASIIADEGVNPDVVTNGGVGIPENTSFIIGGLAAGSKVAVATVS